MTNMCRSDIQAVRAFNRLFAQRTEGWDEHWEMDRGFDGGEYSDAAWGRNYEQARDECLAIVAARFDIDEHRLWYVSEDVNHYENFLYVKSYQSKQEN